MRLFKNKTKQTKKHQKKNKIRKDHFVRHRESFTAVLYIEKQRQDDPWNQGVQGQPGNRVRPHLQHHSIQLNMYFWSVCFKNSVFNYEEQWMNTATFNFRGHKGPLSSVCSASGFPTAHRNIQLKKNWLGVGGGRPSLPVLVLRVTGLFSTPSPSCGLCHITVKTSALL